jgi:hypothetical protein
VFLFITFVKGNSHKLFLGSFVRSFLWSFFVLRVVVLNNRVDRLFYVYDVL